MSSCSGSNYTLGTLYYSDTCFDINKHYTNLGIFLSTFKVMIEAVSCLCTAEISSVDMFLLLPLKLANQTSPVEILFPLPRLTPGATEPQSSGERVLDGVGVIGRLSPQAKDGPTAPGSQLLLPNHFSLLCNY